MRRRAFLVGALGLSVVSTASAQLGHRMPMPAATFTEVQVLPMATRPGGPFAFTAVVMPVGVQGVQATMDISQAADPLPSISLTLEGSLDGGATWMGAGRFDNPAGPKGTNKQGQPKTELGARWDGGPFWSATANANRQLRGGGTLGGSLRFGLKALPL